MEPRTVAQLAQTYQSRFQTLRRSRGNNIGVGSPYYDASGRVEGFRSAALLLTLGINTNTLVEKKIHFYIVDGKKRKVTDVCAEYLALLQRMVADFKADNP
jgi:hypothetical protein